MVNYRVNDQCWEYNGYKPLVGGLIDNFLTGIIFENRG